MWMTILLVVAVLVAGLLAYAATRPNTFRHERSTTIHAPPEVVYPYIADFHRWIAWSPWEGKDPALQRTYSGADSGLGAIYGWVGNKEVGEGRMEITEATPPSHVAIQLDFLKPFEAHSTADFVLQPEGGGTRVTWAMFGPQPFLFKLMGVLMSMDKAIGKDFDRGLAALKAAAEAEAAQQAIAGA